MVELLVLIAVLIRVGRVVAGEPVFLAVEEEETPFLAQARRIKVCLVLILVVVVVVVLVQLEPY